MKRICFILLLLSFIHSCIPSYIDRTKVETRFKRSPAEVTVHVKSLYVLAGGNLASRAIADNIFLALESKMNQNNSKAEFKFINTEQDYTKEVDIKSILSDSFDGYMLLSSNDSKWVDFSTQKFVFGAPVSSGYWAQGSGYGDSYDGDIRVELYNSNKKLLYTGIIQLHFTPSNEFLYRKVVSKLIKELSKVKVQLW